ncbi:MAG: hypothetical protein M1546_15990 [Chloroflexi bacterium]|nr:hypothetical protein [Chloroflexota bacterium]
MSPTASRLIVTGLLFVLTLISGVWVRHSGRRIKVAIFTIHKLIALLTVITIAVTIYHLHQAVEIGPTVEFSAIAVTGLLFLVLFISGAWLSPGKLKNKAALTIHKVTPLLAVISTATTIFLLAGGT